MTKSRDERARAMLPKDEPRCDVCNVLASLGHGAGCRKVKALTLKGLRLNVYTDQSYGPTRTHRGAAIHVAGSCASITVVGTIDAVGAFPDRVVTPLPKVSRVFEPSVDAPAFVLVKRGRLGNILVPFAAPEGLVGPMMGGAYAATSDSRWSDLIDGHYGAVAIHDRYETAALYALNAD